MKVSRRAAIFGMAALGALLLALAPVARLAQAAAGKDRVEGWNEYRPLPDRQLAIDKAATAAFLDASKTRQERYDVLFRYFLWGAIVHGSREGASVHYRGLPSVRGYRVSGLEGFARTAPLFAAWLSSGRPPVVQPLDGSTSVDLRRWIAHGLSAGTDPRSAEFWGDFSSDDQRIVEAADIARTIWLTRTTVWPMLSAKEKANTVRWLKSALAAKVKNNNNWLLFQPVIGSVLYDLGQAESANLSGYHAFAGNYLEAGWFRDGPRGEIDFYNTWGIAYDLYWLHKLNPSLQPGVLQARIGDNAALTRHLISSRGIPILGRSICYRTAVPVSVLAAGLTSGSGITPQQSARALEATWHHFIKQGILRDGTMTMGYFETNPALVEIYSGPGSCHWGLRSLVLAYLHPLGAPFWADEPSPLPVETRNYRISLPKLGWIVEGTRSNGEIVIRQSRVKTGTPRPQLKDYDTLAKIKAWLFHRPFRPANHAAKYGRAEYRATTPFYESND